MTYENYIKKEFIEGLIYFSKGKISKQEAQLIAEKKIAFNRFFRQQPLGTQRPSLVCKKSCSNNKCLILLFF